MLHIVTKIDECNGFYNYQVRIGYLILLNLIWFICSFMRIIKLHKPFNIYITQLQLLNSIILILPEMSSFRQPFDDLTKIPQQPIHSLLISVVSFFWPIATFNFEFKSQIMFVISKSIMSTDPEKMRVRHYLEARHESTGGLATCWNMIVYYQFPDIFQSLILV